MFSQFQTRYPTGSLVSELLQIHDGHYIVRAVVQVGSVTLATGMAAAAEIDQAEDQARIRALAVLGIHPPAYEVQPNQQMTGEETPAPVSLNSAASDTISNYKQEEILTSKIAHHSLDWSTEEARPSVSSTSQPPTNSDLLSHLDPDSHVDLEIQERELDLQSQSHDLHDPEVLSRATPKRSDGNHHLKNDSVTSASVDAPKQGSQNGKVATQSGRVTPKSDTLSKPTDLSDFIAQTSVELKRLNWNDAQGRSYLQRTYSKRSRQQLSDEELLEFLHYLQSQPSADEPSF